MNIAANVLVLVVVLWLVFTYLLPIFPAPIGTVLYVILVLAALVWLLKLLTIPLQ